MDPEGALREIAGWQRWPWLAAGFSTRHGGASSVYGAAASLGDLNLGFTVEDEAAAVLENRRRLRAAFSGGPWQLVTLHQIHGTAVRQVTSANVCDAMAEGRAQWKADGLVTSEPGLLLGVGAADCVPLLLADVRRRVVGGFHAGWRGTAAGMAELALREMSECFGSRPGDCVAAIGPSIGVCCYEVDDTVRTGFLAGPAACDLPSILHAGLADGRGQLDLWTANRLQLERAGISADAITVLGECTACTREPDGTRRYFSHRAAGGRTGRMLGVIGIRC